MRKYIIRDEGEEYEVKEFEREDFSDNDEEIIEEEKVETFTPEEIVILKKILPHVDKLIAMVSEEEEVTDEEEVAETEEEITDTDEEEEVIESEKIEAKAKDSKSSFGAIERKVKKVQDNFDTSIDDAWAKRYNGGNK